MPDKQSSESVRQRLRQDTYRAVYADDIRGIVDRVRHFSRLSFLSDTTVVGWIMEAAVEDPEVAQNFANRHLDQESWAGEEMQLGAELTALFKSIIDKARPKADHGGKTSADVLAMGGDELGAHLDEMRRTQDKSRNSVFIPVRIVAEKPTTAKRAADSREDVANDVADVGKVIIFDRRTVPASDELDSLIRAELRGRIGSTPEGEAAHQARAEHREAWNELKRLAGHAISAMLAKFATIAPKLGHIRDDITGRDLEDMTDAGMQRYGKDWSAADAAARRRWS